MGKVFAVGVGPGSQNYITEIVKKIIVDADVIVGYQYTLNIIADLIHGKKSLTQDLENKENQKISFNNILSIESKEKVWGSVLFLDIIEGGKEKELQFSVVQDWVKYPISAPTKFLKVDWSGFVKYIKDRQIVMK